MNILQKKTTALVKWLKQADESALTDPKFTQEKAFSEWLGAAYSDPMFLFDGDYFEMYDKCRDKAVGTLTMRETRGCLTFLIRQMRCAYVPYDCVLDGSLLAFLEHWLDLTKEAQK